MWCRDLKAFNIVSVTTRSIKGSKLKWSRMTITMMAMTMELRSKDFSQTETLNYFLEMGLICCDSGDKHNKKSV